MTTLALSLLITFLLTWVFLFGRSLTRSDYNAYPPAPENPILSLRLLPSARRGQGAYGPPSDLPEDHTGETSHTVFDVSQRGVSSEATGARRQYGPTTGATEYAVETLDETLDSLREIQADYDQVIDQSDRILKPRLEEPVRYGV